MVEDFSFQVKGPPANYVHGCQASPVTCGPLGYVSYQKGIIQGHPGDRCQTRKSLGLSSRIVFYAVLSLDVSIQIIFLYRMSIKYSLGDYF